MSKAQILYIGNLREGGNGRDRIAIFEAQGYAVEGFNTLPWREAGPRVLRSLTARWQIGPAVSGLNQALRMRAMQGGFDVVVVDKGTVLHAATLRALKAASRKKIAIHYTPDAGFADNRSREFYRAIADYDLLVTTKNFELSDYAREGARQTLLIHQGYGPRIDPKLATNQRDLDVVFLGHCQPHYARMLKEAAQAAPLAIWGPGWPDYAKRHAWARSVVKGPGLYGPDYARTLGRAKIAIGLLSKRVPETTTTRSFEIPAMGTMLLAERTEDHAALFEEGREAAFFSTPSELTEKIVHYLANDAARQAIAQAGQARCQSSGYATARQFARITDWLDEAILSPTEGAIA
ncbi:glycosyl transferase family 1 [Rhodobacter sp. JA431]|uniref:CgeB family protein n=1 Tax=Rhodobacter sp. JA431 TaxID=570013 RepID=UPI000BDB673D|nr:glycosyltransferase [Rhodobacter sp. JA431]SOB99898.1 glycosyl transferase family 1 [Rhodobacter sp. JA431]